MDEQYKKSHIDRLPPELHYLIAEFIPCKQEKPYPYIQLFKNIILNWYNKNQPRYKSKVYHTYEEIYTCGISDIHIICLKYAFKNYRKESKYYNMIMSPVDGQFTMIPFRRNYNTIFNKYF